MALGNLNREDLRQMITNEVSTQLTPLMNGLHGMTRRLDSLYRNGDKTIAPGYLDLRKETDDKRWQDQECFNKAADEKLDAIATNLSEQRGGNKIKRLVWDAVLILIVALLGGIFVILASDHFGWHIVTGQQHPVTTNATAE
jgi:hypothetical protein